MIKDIVEKQRKFYLSGATRSHSFRMEALTKLKQALQKNESLLVEAMQTDLNKSESESFLCEIGMVLDELKYHQKHLRAWMKERRIRPSKAQLPGKCFISPEPYGVTLIMAPWNYPVNLCFVPLIGAISAGNTAVLKPSAYARATSSAIAKVITDTFPPEYITVVEGGRQQNTALLEEKFDYIFFTGSPEVGRIVMAAAAKHLTPVTLELGGKSPVIVDETANIRLAAKRIAFGKVVNAGQTCIAPDYLLIHEQVKESFIKEFAKALAEFFPGAKMDPMCTIITPKHYERLKGLMAGEKILLGGKYDDTRRLIEPTLLDGITLASPIMQEEIFGPLLPILTFKELEECINVIRSLPRPLAFYLFSENPQTQRLFLEKISFGGGCINDTIMHFPNPRLPFGGVGNSGIGSYHGRHSFDTFTHYRSVFKQSTRFDMALRYMPYTKEKLKLIRKLLG